MRPRPARRSAGRRRSSSTGAWTGRTGPAGSRSRTTALVSRPGSGKRSFVRSLPHVPARGLILDFTSVISRSKAGHAMFRGVFDRTPDISLQHLANTRTCADITDVETLVADPLPEPGHRPRRLDADRKKSR